MTLQITAAFELEGRKKHKQRICRNILLFSSAKEGVHVQVCLFVFSYIQDDTHNYPLILAKE